MKAKALKIVLLAAFLCCLAYELFPSADLEALLSRRLEGRKVLSEFHYRAQTDPQADPHAVFAFTQSSDDQIEVFAFRLICSYTGKLRGLEPLEQWTFDLDSGAMTDLDLLDDGRKNAWQDSANRLFEVRLASYLGQPVWGYLYFGVVTDAQLFPEEDIHFLQRRDDSFFIVLARAETRLEMLELGIPVLPSYAEPPPQGGFVQVIEAYNRP